MCHIMNRPAPLELLAPARNCEIAREAILHGADAVYIGGPSHSARAAASNSVDEIAGLCGFAHQFRARVYVTLNTIIFDSELDAVRQTVVDLYRAGTDALIVQDMALLRLDIPPIALHASTQCNARTPEKAKFLAECGFSQIVIPRECSEQEIKDIRDAVPDNVTIEAFVHGALCVSYSGDCQASFTTSGRSANRGTCSQMCRLAYNLTDSEGNILIRDRHLLSLRDLSRLDELERMALAGVSSFKIEGRLKDASYVKTVVGAYRRAIDRVINAHPDRFCRASQGKSVLTFAPDVNNVFNRGFTSYFFAGRPDNGTSVAQIDTPKWIGNPVGKIQSNRGKSIEIRGNVRIANGDGLGYFKKDGAFTGFRVNRAEGNRLFLAKPIDAQPGTDLFRNSSAEYDAAMARDTASRTLSLRMDLRLAGNGRIALRCETEGGDFVEIVRNTDHSAARVPQNEVRRRNLGKLGGTVFTLAGFSDSLPDVMFIPASALTALRREAIEALEHQRAATCPRDCRRAENKDAKFIKTVLDYHDNVANRLSRRFYYDHGVTQISPALECGTPAKIPKECVVMTTRYCLRRQLGTCLRTPEGKKLPSDLFLTNGNVRFHLEFDCSRCQMHVKKA